MQRSQSRNRHSHSSAAAETGGAETTLTDILLFNRQRKQVTLTPAGNKLVSAVVVEIPLSQAV